MSVVVGGIRFFFQFFLILMLYFFSFILYQFGSFGVVVFDWLCCVGVAVFLLCWLL